MYKQCLHTCFVYKQFFRHFSILLLLSGVTFFTYFLQLNVRHGPENVAHFSIVTNTTQIGLEDEPPQQHVYYLKTHKTGSGTMCSILADYIKAHNLLPLLPQRVNINQEGEFRENQVRFIEGVSKYDVVFSHHIFTTKIFKYLHEDKFTVTTLRNPYSNFVSAFNYFRYKWNVRYLVKVPGDDPIAEFLNNPQKYEAAGYKSWTNNRQAMDLGYNMSHRFDDIQYVKSFIKGIENQFDLVLIMEYFDEGLILMKRILRWKTQDILYFSKNKGAYTNSQKHESALEKQQRQLHATFSQADNMLYDHFLKIFEEKMKNSIGLKEETAEFRGILQKLWDFCGVSAQSNSSLVIPAGKWNNGFTITRDKCKWQGLGCDVITKILQKDFFGTS